MLLLVCAKKREFQKVVATTLVGASG